MSNIFHECMWRSIFRKLSWWLCAPWSSVPLLITQYLRVDKNNTLNIFMLSGSIQFYSQLKQFSQYALIFEKTIWHKAHKINAVHNHFTFVWLLPKHIMCFHQFSNHAIQTFLPKYALKRIYPIIFEIG